MPDAIGSTPLAHLLERDSAKGGIPLQRVAREFEALLIGEMLKSGSTPLGDGFLDGGSAGRMYREMFMQEVARRVAARGGFGLADTLEAQLQRQTTEPAETRPAAKDSGQHDRKAGTP